MTEQPEQPDIRDTRVPLASVLAVLMRSGPLSIRTFSENSAEGVVVRMVASFSGLTAEAKILQSALQSVPGMGEAEAYTHQLEAFLRSAAHHLLQQPLPSDIIVAHDLPPEPPRGRIIT